MKKIFVLITVLCLCNLIQAQSPWTQEKGGGFAQLSLMAIPSYDSFFNGSEEARVSDRDYSEFGMQVYAEYGLFENTSIVLDVPFKILNAGESNVSVLEFEEQRLAGLGNIRLAVRQGILTDGLQLAAQVLAEIPTRSQDDDTGLRTGYDAFTIQPSLSIGGGLGKGYIYGYGGIGFRNNEYSTFWNVGFEGGYRPFEPFWAMLFFDVYQSFEDGERVANYPYSDSGFYVNDQAWASLGLKLLYNINDKIGVTAASTLSAFAGNQVPQSPSVSLGVFTEW